VRPAQFGTQCVPNREAQEEGPHVAQVAFIEALAELASEGVGQIGQQSFAVGGPGSTALLELDDVPPDLPVGLHLDGIHRPQHLPTPLGDHATQRLQQGREALQGWRNLDDLLVLTHRRSIPRCRVATGVCVTDKTMYKHLMVLLYACLRCYNDPYRHKEIML